ncbi:MAG: beta-N-acetylhexosaminidase [Proteobacteria bacterium]|nr:beta-N-acetylhexosaminidase [Pseudomonadota bacterium]
MNGRLMISLAGDTELLAEDKEALQQSAVGGVILFSRNYGGSRALRQLTAEIRRIANRPLLIATDHEGGRVQRFRGDDFTHVPAMAKIAASAAPEISPATMARAAGIVLAAELLAHGVDMTFAPVLDLDYGVAEVIGDRAFSADANIVGELALKLKEGLKAAGMPCCGKHFPGHGFVVADSHLELPVDTRSLADLQTDMTPFRRCAAAGMEMVMTAHIVYSAVDSQPATFSPRWLKDILRGELNYQGLVVSDDLSMQGAVAFGDVSNRVSAAAAAGCDLLLLCQPQENSAAIQAMANINHSDAHWQQLRCIDTNRITVGDDSYHCARQQLSVLSD